MNKLSTSKNIFQKINQTNNVLLKNTFNASLRSSVFNVKRNIYPTYKHSINRYFSSTTSLNQKIETNSNKRIIADHKDESLLEGGLYMAVYKNVPNLDEYNPAYDNGGTDANGMNETAYMIQHQKQYNQSDYEDYAKPRYNSMLKLMIFQTVQALPDMVYSPFTNFCQKTLLTSLPYAIFPWLNSRKFPSWINYDKFIKDSIESLLRVFNVAKENDFPTMKDICTPTKEGYGNMIQMRDVFYTYKRIAYEFKFYSIYRIGKVKCVIIDNQILVNVHYIFEAIHDTDFPKSKDITFPIRNESDKVTKSGTTLYTFSANWWSQIPESKNEEDLDWKFDGMFDRNF